MYFLFALRLTRQDQSVGDAINIQTSLGYPFAVRGFFLQGSFRS
jgi:hypothetical protein